jgi:hypothetical protein
LLDLLSPVIIHNEINTAKIKSINSKSKTKLNKKASCFQKQSSENDVDEESEDTAKK